MDNKKIGALICQLRKEHSLTQKELADKMNISDKTVSKWECGIGCPDISILKELASFFEVNIEKLLDGSLETNETDRGNMKKIKFYVCGECGNILTATGEADISCCGRKLTPLTPQELNEQHNPQLEKVEDEFYITFSHEMCKKHFIDFVAVINSDKMIFNKLYPEQSPEVRLPAVYGGKLYFGCSQHGLFVTDIKNLINK